MNLGFSEKIRARWKAEGYRIELIEGMAKNDAQENMLRDFVKKAPEPGKTFGQIVNNWILVL